MILQAEKEMLSYEEIKEEMETLPEVYHIMLKDVPHEFLSKPVEPLLKAIDAFLEAVRS